MSDTSRVNNMSGIKKEKARWDRECKGQVMLESAAALLCVVATPHGGKGFTGYMSSLHITQ